MAFIINQLGGCFLYGVPFGAGQVLALICVAALLWLLLRSYHPDGKSSRAVPAGVGA